MAPIRRNIPIDPYPRLLNGIMGGYPSIQSMDCMLIWQHRHLPYPPMIGKPVVLLEALCVNES